MKSGKSEPKLRHFELVLVDVLSLENELSLLEKTQNLNLDREMQVVKNIKLKLQKMIQKLTTLELAKND